MNSSVFLVLMLMLMSRNPTKRSQHANATYRDIVGRNMLRAFGHPVATMLRHVGCSWLKIDYFQTWANNTQHDATHRNTVAKRTQHVAPDNVEICKLANDCQTIENKGWKCRGRLTFYSFTDKVLFKCYFYQCIILALLLRFQKRSQICLENWLACMRSRSRRTWRRNLSSLNC